MTALARARTLQIGAPPRVDLLPTSETARRERHALSRAWAYAGLASLILVVVLAGGAHALNLQAGFRLESERLRTTQLLTGIAELAPVSQALAERSSIESLRETAMAGDLDWSSVLAYLAERLPGEASIADYTFSAGSVPVGDDPTVEVGVTGTLTVTSPEPFDLVEATRTLRAAEWVLAASVQQLTGSDGSYTYTLAIALDQSAYTGAYTADDTAGEDAADATAEGE